MTVVATSFITIEQNRDPSAPKRVKTRKANCVRRANVTLFFVLGLIGVHVDFESRLPHCNYC
jgi:hypothetical protein